MGGAQIEIPHALGGGETRTTAAVGHFVPLILFFVAVASFCVQFLRECAAAFALLCFERHAPLLPLIAALSISSAGVIACRDVRIFVHACGAA